MKVIKDCGIENDIHRGDLTKQVVMIGEDTAKALPGIKDIGLCIKRFKANIIIHGLDGNVLKPGNKMNINNTEFIITAVGKGCYDECELHVRGNMCPLASKVVFAVVGKTGFISEGDRVTLVCNNG